MTTNRLRELYPDLIQEIERECISNHYRAIEAHEQEMYDEHNEYNSHYYNVDELELYLGEMDWYKDQEMEYMHDKCGEFNSIIGKDVMNADSYWFEQNEIEAFREIWKRRVKE